MESGDDSSWSGYVADSWQRFDRGEIGAEFERLVRPHLTAPPRDILDVGTGPGHFLATLRGYYPAATLTGLDADARHVEVAKRDLDGRGVVADLFTASGAELPFADERFDLVMCQMVMPYSRDDRAFLGDLTRVLRPGGTLWFATHGFGFYAVRIGSRRGYEQLRYSASVLVGALSVLSGWKPLNDTPVTHGWVVRTLGELGLTVNATECNGSYASLPKFIHVSATKPG
jgi:SAM-dependent methyltransferase